MLNNIPKLIVNRGDGIDSNGNLKSSVIMLTDKKNVFACYAILSSPAMNPQTVIFSIIVFRSIIKR
jgi:hypothetical protein